MAEAPGGAPRRGAERSSAHRCARRLAWLACGGVPVLFAWWLTAGFALVVPLFDQLLLLERYDALAAGRDGLGPLLLPHSALQLGLVPRAILAALAFASGWNLRLEAALNLLLATATLLVLLHLALRPPWGSRPAVRIASLLTCFAVWSPALSWSWIWTVSFFHDFGNLCFVLALWALASGDGPLARRRLLFAAACCVTASLDRFEGLFTWIVLLPCVIAFADGTRRRAEFAAAWCALALASGLAVALLLRGAAGAAAGPLRLAGFQDAVLHFLSLIGFPLSAFQAWWPPPVRPTQVYFPMGIALCTALGASLLVLLRDERRELRRRALVWGALASYAALFCAAIAIGRMPELRGNPYWQLYFSTYGTTAMLFGVATLQLAALAWERRVRVPIAAGGLAVGAIALCLAANYAYAVPSLLEARRDSARERYCFELLLHLAPANTCFWGGPNPVNQQRLLVEPILRTGFRRVREDLRYVPVPAPDRGRLTGVRRDPAGGWIVSGWVASASERPPDAVLIGPVRTQRAFAAIAGWERREDGRWWWSARLPETGTALAGRRVGAWLYDRSRGELVALAGSGRVGASAGSRPRESRAHAAGDMRNAR